MQFQGCRYYRLVTIHECHREADRRQTDITVLQAFPLQAKGARKRISKHLAGVSETENSGHVANISTSASAASNSTSNQLNQVYNLQRLRRQQKVADMQFRDS